MLMSDVPMLAWSNRPIPIPMFKAGFQPVVPNARKWKMQHLQGWNLFYPYNWLFSALCWYPVYASVVLYTIVNEVNITWHDSSLLCVSWKTELRYCRCFWLFNHYITFNNWTIASIMYILRYLCFSLYLHCFTINWHVFIIIKSQLWVCCVVSISSCLYLCLSTLRVLSLVSVIMPRPRRGGGGIRRSSASVVRLSVWCRVHRL